MVPDVMVGSCKTVRTNRVRVLSAQIVEVMYKHGFGTSRDQIGSAIKNQGEPKILVLQELVYESFKVMSKYTGLWRVMCAGKARIQLFFFDGIFMSDIIPYSGDSFRDGAVNGVEDKSKSPVLKERLKTEVKREQNSTKNGRARVKQRLRRSLEYS